ncbi:substance-P receptor-like [Pomacea canaliculata]|uniref:substance-P receptor-like n=1 Tax=Pomacea canaliculata TaxID=400727 RepID=UPI000D72DE99|nr:substance-P receptor-like [Pomacea canaliculata]XP_025095511.1 substance-P receptor-like [Pomacea canaliculata]XP_025095512.1 substance-P receptor-like [Pomacea canaliculata]
MNNTSNTEADPYDYYYNIYTLYYASYIWVLAAVGVPGNVACIMTIATMTLTTATLYVVLLAAADLAALVLKVIFHQLSYHRIPENTFICKGDVFVQVVSCYANWMLVLICFERFLTVCYFLRKNTCFTIKRAIVIAVLLGVTLFLCFLYGFINMDKAKAGYCSYPEHAQEFVITYWHWIVASIYFFLPFTLLAIFTSLILVRLRRQRKASEAIGETTENTRERSQMRVELPICIMMVCAAIVFLVLTLPTCIYHLIVAWKKINVDTPQQWFAWAMFQQLAISLSEANHAVNFYIYFLSVRMFRSRFKQLMMKLF